MPYIQRTYLKSYNVQNLLDSEIFGSKYWAFLWSMFLFMAIFMLNIGNKQELGRIHIAKWTLQMRVLTPEKYIYNFS